MRTILLKVRDDEEDVFVKHLSWTEHQGFHGGVLEYTIYRMVNDIKSFELVGRVDPMTLQFTDNLQEAAPMGARVEYMVLCAGRIWQYLQYRRRKCIKC